MRWYESAIAANSRRVHATGSNNIAGRTSTCRRGDRSAVARDHEKRYGPEAYEEAEQSQRREPAPARRSEETGGSVMASRRCTALARERTRDLRPDKSPSYRSVSCRSRNAYSAPGR
jgi:hypothetical protein